MSTAPKYQPHYTLADYELWEGDWELWYGTAVAMSPAPFESHEFAVSALSYQIHHSILEGHCRCAVYTGLDWYVSDDTVVRPDVMLVCGRRPSKRLERPPSLTIEILSKSTAHKDRTAKRDLYESQGVEHYLLVDVDEQSLCWLALQADGKYADVSDQIPADGKFDITLRDGCVLHFNREQAFGER